jgi:Tol biopolymer transport system component
MDVDGSGQRFLTYEHNEVSPAWSPDGRQIVYQSGGQIYAIGVDGADQRSLGNGTSPAWSPDGRHIAFIELTDNYARQRLRVMDTDGANVRTVFETRDEWLGKPSWSPAADVLAFVRDPDGHDLGAVAWCGVPPNSVDCASRYGPEPSGLWRVGADGKGVRRISAPRDDYEATFSR